MPRIIKPAVGSFTASNITIDSSGRVVAASSGAGAANMLRTTTDSKDGSKTFTAQPGTSKLHLFMRGAGGGGGGGFGGSLGFCGGHGAFGFFNVPVSQPFSVPYTVGAGGTGGVSQPHPQVHQPGNAGTASSFNTNLVANGGNGGLKQQGGSPGTPGTLQNETFAYIDGNTFAESNLQQFVPEGMSLIVNDETDARNGPFYGQNNATLGQANLFSMMQMNTAGHGGAGGSGPSGALGTRAGSSGTDGAVVIYEDIG